jgi:sugar phosphate isomerase/epimerase
MKSHESISRRKFLGNAALVSSAILGGPSVFGVPAYHKNSPSSLINGVQIGVITYSFREMPDQSAQAILQYVLDSGISAIELMGDPVEIFAGRPKNPVDMRTYFPLMRKKRDKVALTVEETKIFDDLDSQMKVFNLEVKKWRQTVSMDPFEKLAATYQKAGVKVYAYKPNAFNKDNSDEEVEFGMKVARIFGANQVTLEHPSDDSQTLRLAKFAEKIGLKVAYHGHEQQTPTFWDTALSQSKANALNIDLGHFVAAGNQNPLEFIKKMHANIASMHIKDRQNAQNGKGNLVWGTGDTPIAEVLKIMRDQKFVFPATIELEYKIPEGSNSVKEVKKCLEYCKNALS